MRPQSETMRTKRAHSSAVSWKDLGPCSNCALPRSGVRAGHGVGGTAKASIQRGIFTCMVFNFVSSWSGLLLARQAAELKTADGRADTVACSLLLDPHDPCGALHFDGAAGEVHELEAELDPLPFFECQVGHEVDAARADVARQALASVELQTEVGFDPLLATLTHERFGHDMTIHAR